MLNKNELCMELNKILHESGWLAKATEYYQNHPETYHESKYGGYISSLSMSLSCQVDKLSDVKYAEPFIFIDIYNSSKDCYSLNEFSNAIQSSFNHDTVYTYEKKPVSISRLEFYEHATVIGNTLIKRYTAGELHTNHIDTRTWSIDDWDNFLDRQDIKDAVEYYRDSRHVWCVIKGQFWENTKTGDLGQDIVCMEAWF